MNHDFPPQLVYVVLGVFQVDPCCTKKPFLLTGKNCRLVVDCEITIHKNI